MVYAETGPSASVTMGGMKAPSVREKALLARLVEELDSHAPIAPDPRDVARALGVPVQAIANVTGVGIREGELIEGRGGLIYPLKSLERLLALLPGPEFTVAETRDALGTTRRFADAVLEGLEAIGRLERVGGRCTLVAAEATETATGTVTGTAE